MNTDGWTWWDVRPKHSTGHRTADLEGGGEVGFGTKEVKMEIIHGNSEDRGV